LAKNQFDFFTAITVEDESLPMAVIGFPLPKTNFFFAEAGVRFKGASPSAPSTFPLFRLGDLPCGAIVFNMNLKNAKISILYRSS
jgi:hypothetical protein